MVTDGIVCKYGGKNSCAASDRYGQALPGVLGTGVVKLPGLNCGRTGLGEMQAAKAGFNVETAVAVTDDKAHYYPDSSFFITKLIADKNTHKLLGAQVIGPGAVDKMIDIAVTGINLGARIEDFENADYAYAPPFSTAIHPVCPGGAYSHEQA